LCSGRVEWPDVAWAGFVRWGERISVEVYWRRVHAGVGGAVGVHDIAAADGRRDGHFH